MMFMAVSSGEVLTASPERFMKPWAVFMLILSSSTGIGIGWSGWNCRNKVSATTYTLLGVASKLISVLLNVLIWDKHASSRGLAALALCLVSSMFYRQSPL